MSQRARDRSAYRRVLRHSLLGLTAVWTVACGTRGAFPQADVWIRDVHVIDTETGAIARNRAIAIRADTISSVIANDDVPAGSSGRMLDGRGAYAVPGLWDAHVHLMQGGGEGSMRRAARLLSFGITHARDMGSSLFERTEFLTRVRESGSAPVVFSAGPTFWAFSLPYGDAEAKMLVEDPATTEQAVDSLADAGVDFLKVYAGFTPDRLQRLVDAATRRGLRVAGHAQPGATLAEQARMGVTTVEHLDFSTLGECSARADAYFERVIAARFRGSGERVPDIYASFAEEVDTADCRTGLRRAAEAGLVVTPTLVATFLPYRDASEVSARLAGDERESCDVYLRDADGLSEPQRAVLPAAGRRLLQIVRDAGLPIMAGSDAPVFCTAPGESLVQELVLLEAAGLSPLAVLQSATTIPSRTLRPAAALGRLTQGSEAHVLLLQENPLASASAYRQPVGLYTQGVWRDETALRALRGP